MVLEDNGMKKIIHNFVMNKIFCRGNVAKVRVKETTSRQFPYKIEVIAENLYVPWAISLGEQGEIYFTERSGSIRVIKEGKLQKQPLITFSPPFISQGEGGVLGIALDPNFSKNHYMYAMHSYEEDGQLYNRIVRLVENNDRASIDRVLMDRIPGGRIHNGGRIKIGPDQKLYITTGDAGNSALAQDITSTAGKILRIELDGSIPKDNPIHNSPVYSLGHRDPQGLAWNSESILYESEHGQFAHDEINIIKPGANYGWPIVQGDEESTKIITQKPLVQSGEDTWAPSGITFVSNGLWQGKLLVANLRGQQLLAITLDNEGTKVTNIDSWLKNEYGRLREVIEGKNGEMYITTSNRDGRGTPVAADDRIIKLSPK